MLPSVHWKEKRIPESVDDLKSEMKVLLAMFSTFRESPMQVYKPFRFLERVHFYVMLFQQFTKVERTGDWPLQLRATSELIP